MQAGIYILVNGKAIAATEPAIHAHSSGLRYGDGLFETIRYKEGQILFADDHFERLFTGLDLLQFDVPLAFTAKNLAQEIHYISKMNGLANARVRLSVYRKNGGLHQNPSGGFDYIIEAFALDNFYTKNISLKICLYDDVRKQINKYSNLKHNNALLYIMGAQYAKKQGFDDCLLINEAGNICETSIANIFFVRDDTLITPALTEGCVAGIMRNQVIHYCREHDILCTEQSVRLSDLESMHSAFTCNAIRGLSFVSNIGNSTFSPNSIIDSIRSAFI